MIVKPVRRTFVLFLFTIKETEGKEIWVTHHSKHKQDPRTGPFWLQIFWSFLHTMSRKESNSSSENIECSKISWYLPLRSQGTLSNRVVRQLLCHHCANCNDVIPRRNGIRQPRLQIWVEVGYKKFLKNGQHVERHRDKRVWHNQVTEIIPM